jgi:signal transduction histidine kinase
MSTASSASSRERRRLLLDVLLPVAALILLGAAVNVFLINRAGATLDDEAGRTQKQIVSSMTKRLLVKLDRFVGDFALWDEFYTYSEEEKYPVEWSDANLGPYIADAFDASGAWVVSEDGRLLYSWSEDPSKDPVAIYNSGPDLKRMAQVARDLPDREGSSNPVSAYISENGVVHIAAAAVIVPTSPEMVAKSDKPRNVFIVMSDLDATGYQELAEDFELSGLKFAPDAPTEAGIASVPLLDVDKATIGYLAWQVDSRFGAFMKGYGPAALALLLAIAAIVAILGLRWTRTIDRLQSVTLAADAAESASHAKSAFIANMSHELRTPLNAIIGFGEVMEMESYGPLGNDKYREYAGDVVASGRHLLSVINDVLAVARIEAGQHSFDIDTCDVAEIAEEAMRMVRQDAEDRGVVLSVATNEALVLADARGLRQILLNLLSNAVKFTNEGGKIGVSWSERRMDNTVEISVTDTGVGIPADKIPLLGTPFFQVSDVLARNHAGMGLGLSIVTSMAKGMGGSVNIHSVVNAGTTVRVRLPAAALAKPSLAQAAA